MIDLVLFFKPSEKILEIFGIERYFFFGKGGDGMIIEGGSAAKVRRIFVRNYRKVLFFGYRWRSRSDLIKICREGLIDFVVRPPIDKKVLKFMKENKIFAVFSMRDVIRDPGREISYIMDFLEFFGKKVKVIFSSFSSSLSELKSKETLYSFLRFVGIDDPDKVMEDNPRELYKICSVRKKSILPGVLCIEKNKEEVFADI